MSFQILTKSFGPHVLFQLMDAPGMCKVSIIPSCGALLNNFVIKNNDTFIDVVNGYKSADDLAVNVNQNFKGVILSPFANRVNKATYSFNNSSYVLDKVWKDKDYSIHGYLFDKAFEVISEAAGADEAVLVLKNNYDGKLPGFPFKYETEVIYTLAQNNYLHCKTKVTNKDTGAMPLSFGWHPLFFNDVNINDTELEFASLYQVEVDENYIPTGDKIPYEVFNEKRKIGDTFFDTCFHVAENKNAVLTLIEPANRVQVELTIETGHSKFNYLQLYIPPQRNTIAVEPMTSWPDAFNNENDLLVLQPGETAELSYSIKVNTF